MTIKHGAKRTYTAVSVNADGVLVLDGKPVLTPQGMSLAHASSALMQAIAAEWREQGQTLALHAMPLMRMLVALLEWDATTVDRQQQDMMRFVEGDTIRYFAPKGDALCEKQQALWMPWLDWAARHYGMLWPITHHFTPPATPEALRAAVAQWLDGRAKEEWLVVCVLTQALTSLIMATALVTGVCTPEQALEVVWLEHDHQTVTWGEDAEMAAQRTRMLQNVRDVMRFLALAKSFPTP